MLDSVILRFCDNKSISQHSVKTKPKREEAFILAPFNLQYKCQTNKRRKFLRFGVVNISVHLYVKRLRSWHNVLDSRPEVAILKVRLSIMIKVATGECSSAVTREGANGRNTAYIRMWCGRCSLFQINRSRDSVGTGDQPSCCSDSVTYLQNPNQPFHDDSRRKLWPRRKRGHQCLETKTPGVNPAV